MPARSSDRNLLVGILALQLEFISRDQLVAAMQWWMREKNEKLEDILVKQQSLTTDTRKLLEALVEKHLEIHGHDAERSLKEVSSIGPLKNDLQSIADTDLEASLAQVSSERATHAADATRTFTVPSTAIQAKRFCVLRLHDQGGLGAVYVARDAELNREVALKEIKKEFADDTTSRERFLVEAEVTGGLEHPGIVPVYGLGQYADGRPFYAMRFVRGESLKEAIAKFHNSSGREDYPARRLQFRDLLGRFIDVCQAIEYAHCRGVLHRDLKPGNIMLGRFGETLVVDWGLAKPIDDSTSRTEIDEPPLRPLSSSGSIVTRMGSRLGTPAYMSPEQANGRLDLLNSATDVYCLGATLYALLTGAAPFSDSSPEAMARKVERGEFPRPRERNSQVGPALEAICLKAMARQQSARYQSAAALAADVERWLADEAVSAWQEPVSLRARRWMRRHRTLVTSTATTAIVALMILAVAVVVVSTAYRRELAARAQAETNLALARTAVDTMLTQVGDEALADVPQMESIRRDLLSRASNFYEQFANQKPDDLTLRLDAALALRRVGDIHRLLQSEERSSRAYEESIRRLEQLRAENPEDPLYARQLADTYNWLGVLLKRSDLPAAERAYDRAIELQETLVRGDSPKPIHKQQLARSLYNRAIVYAESGSYQQAVKEYGRAIEMLSGLIDSHADPISTSQAEYRQELARCYNNLANLLMASETETALEQFDLAIKSMRELASHAPEDREFKRELATYYNNRANVQRHSDPRAAEESSNEAIKLFEELAHPIPSIRNEYGNSLQSRGVILVDAGKPDEAAAAFNKARMFFTELAEQFRSDPEYRVRLGNALHELGKLRFVSEAHQEASNLAREAMDLHRQALRTRPDNQTYREHLANDLYLGAWCLVKLRDYSNAVHYAKECVAVGTESRAAQIASDIEGWIEEIRNSTEHSTEQTSAIIESLNDIVQQTER